MPAADPEQLDLFDVMRYEQLLSDFMNEHSDFDRLVKESAYPMPSNEPARLNELEELGHSPLRARESHPLISRVAIARSEIEHAVLTGNLSPIDPVIDVVNAGRAIEVFPDLGVLDLTDNDDYPDVAGEYVTRLLNEDESTDTLFELETAAVIRRNGFDVQLVKEGDVGGRDLIVVEDGVEVSVECKRKDRQVPFDESMEAIGKKISDRVWKAIDIGMDSWAVRISSDVAPQSQHVEELASALASVLQNQEDDRHVSVDGDEFTIVLEDYHNGPRVETRIEGPPALASEMVEVQAEIDPLGHLDYDIDSMDTEGHANVNIFVNEMGLMIISNAYIIAFDFPKYDFVRLNDWVTGTIRRAREQLSGNAPSIVFLDMHRAVFSQMQQREVESYHGGTVSQWERLVDEQIIGILKDSKSVNAVVFSSKSQQLEDGMVSFGRPIEAGAPVHSVINEDPAIELPPRIRRFIDGTKLH